MDWEPIWKLLSALYTETIDFVRDRYPEVHAGTSRSLSAGRKFVGQALFMRDPVTQEHEDLILDFQCGPSESGFSRADGSVLMGVNARDAVGFEIQRGTGKSLAILEPVVLAQDDSAAAYSDAVTAYAQAVVLFVRSQKELMVSALASTPLGDD